MHVISYRRLREYGEIHADCCDALDNWVKVAQKAGWSNLIEVQAVFPTAEAVGSFTVFNIKGNKYRLIVSIDYEKQVIYIKMCSLMPNTTRSSGKMTLTFNPDRYATLLTQYQPKVIQTEAENEQALQQVEALMQQQNRSPEETVLYELLVILIEKFEQEYYAPGKAATPLSMLPFLMEQQNYNPSDLITILGSEEMVTRIMQQQQALTVNQIQALGEFFNVDPSVFV
jgi:HTH-type transcriptional regulator/antitoxin HigA